MLLDTGGLATYNRFYCGKGFIETGVGPVGYASIFAVAAAKVAALLMDVRLAIMRGLKNVI
ncbi:hypothetical protein CJJ13_05160 [Serratia fonticola]|nr:hypothetical protein CJJ13_05160 [Serratia fonticola]